MKQREFNKNLNSICRKVNANKVLSLEKLQKLPIEIRQAMGNYIIHNRGPVLVQLTEGLNDGWLNAMGYFHVTRSKVLPELVFRHTAEHKIK